MTESSLNFTKIVCLILMVVAVVFLWPRGDDPETASLEPEALGRTAAEGGSRISEGGEAGEQEAGGPRLDTKSKERPGPDEMAEMRLKRKRQELMDELESLKAGGLGPIHPQVKAKQAELDALAEEAEVGE